MTGESATIDLALFSAKSCRLRVIDNANGEASLSDAMPRINALAGVNGGYFDPNFAPIGLRIIDGKIIRPLIHARLLTGVLVASADSIQIFRVAEYSKSGRSPFSAVQCGPLLVDGGRPVRGLDATRMARRTFAAVATADHAALGFCSEVSLSGMAQILGTAPLADDFKINRALNLDGGSSSAFWFKRSGSVYFIPEQKAVRDFVGVVAR